jgi:hypothetical protein
VAENLRGRDHWSSLYRDSTRIWRLWRHSMTAELDFSLTPGAIVGLFDVHGRPAREWHAAKMAVPRQTESLPAATATCQNRSDNGQLTKTWREVLNKAMDDHPQDDTRDALARLERELLRLKNGLELLGVKACCCCQNLFRATEPGNLFNAGDLVCFACIRHWWPQRSQALAANDRELIEHKLVHWLLNHHGAKVVPGHEKSADDSQGIRLVAACEECEGKGLWAGTKCHFCGGSGAVCVVVPNPETA